MNTEAVPPPAPPAGYAVHQVERTGAYATKVRVTAPARDALFSRAVTEAVLSAVQQAGFRPQGLADMPVPYPVFADGASQPVGYAADYSVTLVV